MGIHSFPVTTDQTNPANHRTFPTWLTVAAFSILLLIPCFWQSRIQSADLSSHVYNAWLASRIRQGAAPGLWISPQTNNILFDLMLERLFTHAGEDLAQRISVAVSVLIFGWGAVILTFRIAGRNWWLAAPCVAMLAYGFILHMGFFNFYLSLGLCLWYLAIFWNQRWMIRFLAVPLLMLAWTAHPFPVVWAAGMAAYIALAQSIEPRQPLVLPILGFAALIIVRCILTYKFRYAWSLHQAFFITGANELELFGSKYIAPFAALLFIWLNALRTLIKRIGVARLVSTISFQLWLLNAAAVVLIPDRLFFPRFALPFSSVTDRLSLAAGLMMCCVLAAEPVPRFFKAALPLVAALFFGLLYADDRKLNLIEDRLDAVVSQVPQESRVISFLQDRSLRALCVYHDLDRACIGHCFSYANYEPSSRQFRIRARPNNGIVLDDFADPDAVANGTYVIQPRDVPIYLIYPCEKESGNFCLRLLRVGDLDKVPN